MSWDLHTVREGAALAIKSIPGLSATAYIPTKILPPVAIIATGSGEISSQDPIAEVELLALVLVSRVENAAAQKKLDEYCSTNTNKSVERAILDNPGLPFQGANTCDDAVVVGWDAPAKYEIGGAEYFGVQFHLAALLS